MDAGYPAGIRTKRTGEKTRLPRLPRQSRAKAPPALRETADSLVSGVSTAVFRVKSIVARAYSRAELQEAIEPGEFDPSGEDAAKLVLRMGIGSDKPEMRDRPSESRYSDPAPVDP